MLKRNPARPSAGKLEVSVPRLNNATEWHHTGYLFGVGGKQGPMLL